MKKVFLVHQDVIQHYRVSVYNYLAGYLQKKGFELIVISEGIQSGATSEVTFYFEKIKLSIKTLLAITKKHSPQAVIFFVNHSRKYYFPVLAALFLFGIKTITWTHGMDLQSKKSVVSRLLHHIEHQLCWGIILYAEHLRPQLLKSHQKKAFIANNTLNLSEFDSRITIKSEVLLKYGITTTKNIICLGRIQKRKRVEDLFLAFKLLGLPDVGLIFAGPDEEGITTQFQGQMPNIFITGPVYGGDAIDLMRASSIYCIPGAIGLSIVDAQYCGLPVVTEDVDHGPEIMYLKQGKNGFIVPVGDIQMLSQKLEMLLLEKEVHEKYSEAALQEFLENAHIDNMCKGFVECLQKA